MGHYNLLVDGSVAFTDVGKEKSLDTVNIKDPIVAFIFVQVSRWWGLSEPYLLVCALSDSICWVR